jgi:hypothetical protein
MTEGDRAYVRDLRAPQMNSILQLNAPCRCSAAVPWARQFPSERWDQPCGGFGGHSIPCT